MPKKASKKRKLPAETETRDAGDASQTRQNNNPPPEIREEHNRHGDSDEEMRDDEHDEPDEPELSGITDDTSADDCIAQCHEALNERAKKTYDLMVVLCRNVDALVNKTLDECGENQAVSRVVADLQACMKASIVTHLSFARADSAKNTRYQGAFSEPPPKANTESNV